MLLAMRIFEMVEDGLGFLLVVWLVDLRLDVSAVVVFIGPGFSVEVSAVSGR
jgi:hypothetical protein